MPSISHHYLPITYLRRFLLRRQKKLWVFDKSTSEFTEATPKESGCEDYYHAFTCKDGTVDTDSIEQDLGRIETNIDGVYEKVRGEKPLTPKEWSWFFIFAGSLMVRVPSFVNRHQDFWSEAYQYAFDLMRSNPKVLKDWEQKGIATENLHTLTVTADHGVSLLVCLDSMRTPIQLFSKMGWRFLKAPSGSVFITGDTPVSYRSPSHVNSIFPAGLATEDIEVIFPFSKSVCALGTWQKPDFLYVEVDTNVVLKVNCRVARAAKQHMYGPRNIARDFCLSEKAEPPNMNKETTDSSSPTPCQGS